VTGTVALNIIELASFPVVLIARSGEFAMPWLSRAALGETLPSSPSLELRPVWEVMAWPPAARSNAANKASSNSLSRIFVFDFPHERQKRLRLARVQVLNWRTAQLSSRAKALDPRDAFGRNIRSWTYLRRHMLGRPHNARWRV
jgi:hypothetical protein